MGSEISASDHADSFFQCLTDQGETSCRSCVGKPKYCRGVIQTPGFMDSRGFSSDRPTLEIQLTTQNHGFNQLPRS